MLMAAFKTLDDIGDVTGKVALVRVDLNLPMSEGEATDLTRVRAVAPTILELADAGAKVLLLAHFGRPKGARNSTMSTSVVQGDVEKVLGRELMFISEVSGPVVEQSLSIMQGGDIGLLENTRFWPGEEANDRAFAQGIAANGDIYVNDAFSAAHRAHASTEGLAHLLPAYAGRSMQAELEALDKALGNPQPPVAAVVGGAKISTKLDVLENLVGKVAHLIIGGGMANTFLAARGVDVGKSLAEHDLAEKAGAIMDAADRAGCTVHLPYDVVVAKEFAANPPSLRTCNVHEVAADEMILDIGPQATEALADVLKTCRTLVWNGPLGAFGDAAVRCRHRGARPHRGGAHQGGLAHLGRGRRRYGGGTGAGGCRRRFHLCLDRRRRLPRMDGGQGAARRRRPRALMDAGLVYAHQQFLTAVESMATGEGALRERIAAAYAHFRPIRREDFSGELRERYIHLMKALTGSEGKRSFPTGIDPAAILDLLRGAPDAKVAEIADYIFSLFLTLHRRRFTGAAPE